MKSVVLNCLCFFLLTGCFSTAVDQKLTTDPIGRPYELTPIYGINFIMPKNEHDEINEEQEVEIIKVHGYLQPHDSYINYNPSLPIYPKWQVIPVTSNESIKKRSVGLVKLLKLEKEIVLESLADSN